MPRRGPLDHPRRRLLRPCRHDHGRHLPARGPEQHLRRDIGIIKLNTSAGEPPSAVTLLERFAAIGNRAELRDVLREARNWCATVRQSHPTHPSLIYFQSVGPAPAGRRRSARCSTSRCSPSIASTTSALRPRGPAARGRHAHGARACRRHRPAGRLDAGRDEAELRQAAERLAAPAMRLRATPISEPSPSSAPTIASCVDALADASRQAARRCSSGRTRP